MLVSLSMWLMAAALGQAPADAAWLKAVPADVDVAIRIRGLESTRDDLSAMLKAMSPMLADQAIPALTAQLDQFKTKYGEGSVKSPWVGLVRLPAAGEGGPPTFAVLVLEGDHAAVLKTINGGKAPELKPHDGGYDAFDAPDGSGSWYTVKGNGFTAFGPDKNLIAAVAKPTGKTLDKVLTPALTKPFLGGDVGLYVNASALVARYGDQIETGRQGLMGALDQAGQQKGNAASIEAAKAMYGGLFDALKYADVLTLDLDFSAEALDLAGVLAAKPDSAAAKAIVGSKPGRPVNLGKLAPDAAFFAYMNLNPKSFSRLQGMAMNMINPSGKTSPEQQKAMAQLEAAGQVEATGATTMLGGMKALNDIKVADPKAYVDANLALLKAMSTADSPLNVYKEVKVDEKTESYQGLTFTHVAAKLDLDKLAKLSANNPGAAESVKSMFGGESLNYWFGTDGKRLLHVTAANWDNAKAQVDAYLKGDAGIGTTPGFKPLLAKLPDTATFMMLISAQGLTKMIASQLASTLNKPNIKVPDDLPKDPALIGLSLTPSQPNGYEFHLVVPSPVGQVIEKGMLPVFRGIQGGN
jgi:hypothetical protein